MELVSAPLAVSEGFQKWLNEVAGQDFIAGEKTPRTSPTFNTYFECVPVAEVERTLLCGFRLRADMNAAFTRLALYSEGERGVDRGSFFKHDDFIVRRAIRRGTGHNIPGAKFEEFFERLEKFVREPGYGPNEFEEQLKKNILESPLVAAWGGIQKTYIICVSLESLTSSRELLTHELSHARFAHDEKYRSTVLEFWQRKLLEGDREIAKYLMSFQYNKKHEDVLIDEWQAAALEENQSQQNLLAWGESLRGYLKKQGIPLLPKIK